MNVVILGDKHEKGTKSKGCQALLPFNKKINYIQHQYKLLSENIKKSKIIYISGLGSNKIQKDKKEWQNIHILNNSEYDNKNYAHSMSLSVNLIEKNNSLLILFGNTTISKKILCNIQSIQISSVFKSKNESIEKLGCISDKGLVKNIHYRLPQAITNMYYIHQKDIDVFLGIITNKKHQNKFIFEVLNLMIDQNIPLGIQ
jgi:choline kinase